MRLLRSGMPADETALLASYHGNPAVELAGRMMVAGSSADEALLTVLGTLSVKDTGRANLELVAGRFEGGTRASVTGSADYAHELPQAMDYVNRQPGGGEFRFAGKYGQGIEGEFLPTGARPDQTVPFPQGLHHRSPAKCSTRPTECVKVQKLPAVRWAEIVCVHP
jgi:hypothetical protein